MDDTGLTELEMQIAEARFRGLSYRQIAAQVGKSYHAIWMTARRPEVEAFIRQLSDDARGAIRHAVVASAPAGVATLVEVARDKKATAAARVSAARALVELAFPAEPVRVVHAGEPEAPIQHVLAGVDDSTLDALCLRLGLTP